VAGAAYLVLLAAFFRGAFLFQESFYRGNLLLHALPNGEFGVHWLRSGVLPLWNPHVFCGYPWLADPLNAALYPFHLVFFLLTDGATAVNLEVLFHFWLAGMFMFAFGRSQSMTLTGALVSGCLFMLNGFMVDYYDQLEGLRTMVWLPLLLLCISKGAQSASYASIPAVGAVLGIQFHGGHFQYAIYNMLFGFAYFIFVGIRRPKFLWCKDLPALLGRWAAISAVGLGLFAVQFLPTYELTQLSARSQMPLAKILENKDDLLSRSLFAKFIAPTRDGGPVDDVQPVYIGVVAVLLAILALGSSRRGDVLFFAGIILASLLLMAGPRFFGYMLLYKAVPGFKFFKDPLRFVFPAIAALSILAGFGLDAFVRLPKAARPSWAVCAGLVWLILLLLIAMAYVPKLYLADLPWDRRGVLALPHFRFLMRDALTALTGLGLVLWLLAAGRRLSDRALGAGALVCLAASLFPFGGLVAVETAPASIHEPDPGLLEAIRSSGPSARLYAHPMLIDLFYNYEYLREMKTMGLIGEAEEWRNDGLIGATPARFGLSAVSDFSVYPLLLFVEETFAERFDPEKHSLSLAGGTEFLKDPNALRRLGCAWILMPASLPLPDDLAREWKLAASTPLVLAYFNPAVNALPVSYADIALEGTGTVETGTRQVSPNEMVIPNVVCPSTLDLRQSAYPGWFGGADAAACTAYKTRQLMLTMQMNVSGIFEVKAVFAPRSFKFGLALTLLTLAACCAALTRRLVDSRAAGSPSTCWFRIAGNVKSP
jgi:hypothetical protein